MSIVPLIVVTGPESSGKTTLAQQLARRTGWPLVSEVARQQLERTGPVYRESDVYRLALLQAAAIEQMCQHAETPVLADTDLLTYRIWLTTRFGRCAEWLINMHHRQAADLYLLCAPDLPWQADPLRENPLDRDDLFVRHQDMLDREGLPYREIRGVGDRRPEQARVAIRSLIGR